MNPSSKLEKNKNILVQTKIETPLGCMIGGASTKGICFLEFVDRNTLKKQIQKLEKKFQTSFISSNKNPFLKQIQRQLDEYFLGQKINFEIPLDIEGTEFQKKVWKALQEIPYGETISYQKQALAIQNPKAIRAVANANGANKIAILIPCHRVIGKNGTLTGYGGGIWRKEALLKLEESR